MQGWTLGIAVFGAVVATASLTWNVVQFLLGGARPKAHLVVGALSPSGGLIAGPPSDNAFRTVARLAKEGYPRPVIGVKVINHGRAPARVQKWSLKCMAAGVAYTPIGDSIGPTLPHDLPAQASETWVVDLQFARALVHTAATSERNPEPVRVIVELGTGRTLVSRKSLPVAQSSEEA
jgi:hypothetical protein